ncbi:MAG: hypothetical protein H6510_00170 [Acidobacteria bacterium]|nr:hypothetical protein [Acidobacteriota bacterium]
MSGKERGLGSRVRDFIARLQKEIDFPAVYSLRIRIPVGVNSGLRAIRPRMFSISDFKAQVRSWPLEIGATIQSASLTTPPLQVMSIFSDESVSLHSVTESLQKPNVRHENQVMSVHIQQPKVDLIPPGVWGRIPPFAKVKLNRTRALHSWSIRLHQDPDPIQKIPIKVPIISVPDLPKALIIRYRATILKMLGWSPAELEWAGVSQRLPPVALKPVGLEEEDHQIKVLLEWTARHHSHGEDRVMALVRKAGSDSWVFLPLREG